MSEAAAEKPPVEVIKRLSKLPTMKIKAGPRDGDLWLQRLEEEYKCLIMVWLNEILTHSTAFEAQKSPNTTVRLVSLISHLKAYQLTVSYFNSVRWTSERKFIRLVQDWVQRGGHKMVRNLLARLQPRQVRIWCGIRHSRHIPHIGTRNWAATTRWKDGQDVQRREDLFNRPLLPSLGQERSQVWYRACASIRCTPTFLTNIF